MVVRSVARKSLLLSVFMLAAICLVGSLAFAQEEQAEEGVAADEGIGNGLKALGLSIGAGIAVAGAGLATGRAQAGVGAGGTGAIAEKPELFANVLILFAIPETIVILGFVIAFLLINKI